MEAFRKPTSASSSRRSRARTRLGRVDRRRVPCRRDRPGTIIEPNYDGPDVSVTRPGEPIDWDAPEREQRRRDQVLAEAAGTTVPADEEAPPSDDHDAWCGAIIAADARRRLWRMRAARVALRRLAEGRTRRLAAGASGRRPVTARLARVGGARSRTPRSRRTRSSSRSSPAGREPGEQSSRPAALRTRRAA